MSRLPREVVVEARAKLNLWLAIGPRRDDGFHDIATVFQSVTLADTLVARRTQRGFTLRVRHEQAALNAARTGRTASAVPAGRDNLVLRAARLMASELALEGGASFTLTKRIPVQAGLGGGSADAAAAMVAMLALHGRRLPRARLEGYALQLGSDVPFAIRGGTALGMGRGEILTRLLLATPLHAIVAMPEWRISTADAYAAHDAVRKRLTLWKQEQRFAATLVRKRVAAPLLMRRGNGFERLLGSRRHGFSTLCARLRTAGLQQPRLTGSGSAVFAIVPRGASVQEITGRFSGNELLYEVRSSGRGLRLRIHASATRPGKGSRAGAPSTSGVSSRRRTRAS